MKLAFQNRFKRLTVLAILLASISISCESARPPLEAYRLKPTDERTLTLSRDYIVQYARKQIGCKYISAGKNNTGFDCSGVVIYVFREFQIPMAASSHEQAKQGKGIQLKEARTGDLIFFGTSKHITHVGIISKNQKSNVSVIHSTSSRGVIEENILKSDYWVRRIQKVVSINSYLKSNEISSL